MKVTLNLEDEQTVQRFARLIAEIEAEACKPHTYPVKQSLRSAASHIGHAVYLIHLAKTKSGGEKHHEG